MQEAKAAKAWNLSLRQWRAESADDRGFMLAMELYELTIQGYRSEYMEENPKHGKRGGKYSKDTNPYHQLLAGFKLKPPSQ